jgi:carboxymethylenebutenolidase
MSTLDRDDATRRCFLCEAASLVAVTAAAAQDPGPGSAALMQQMLKILDDPSVASEVVTFNNRTQAIEGFLAEPRRIRPIGTVLVVPGDFGLGDYTRVTTAQLAQAGFRGLAVDLFSRAKSITDLQQARRVYFDVMSDAQTLQDLQAAVDYARKSAKTSRTKLGVLGFCLGGRYALILAALSRDVAAAVAYYGPLLLPAGEDSVKIARPTKLLNHDMSPLDYVDWIKVPVQGHYARKDGTIPVEDVTRFEAELGKRGTAAQMFLYDTESHFHSFHEPFYNADAARLSWARVIAFLRERLK